MVVQYTLYKNKLFQSKINRKQNDTQILGNVKTHWDKK